MTTITATTVAAPDTTAQTTAANDTAVDFNMFLKLLTTQMQNQDPLKPMDSTEYTQQLAQFTQVQQTVKQTSTLSDILSQLTTQSMTQASGYIGQTGQFDYAVAGLSDTAPAQWNYSASSPVSSLTAKITDATGKTVLTKVLGSSQTGDFAWDGTLANGGKAAPGSYTLALSGLDSKGGTVPVTVNTSGTITDVVGANGSVTVGVNGAQVPLAKLIRLSTAE